MAAKKSTASKTSVIAPVEPLIREIRGEKVILDTDLAGIYGIPTFRLNEAIKRNKNRFPPDFMFQLSQAEFETLKSQTAISEMEGTANSSQIAMSSRKHRGTAYRPYAFTEHGAIMAAKCPEQRTRRADERVCRPRLLKNARLPGR